MNWGTKLVIGMALFISFIVTLGVLMIRDLPDCGQQIIMLLVRIY